MTRYKFLKISLCLFCLAAVMMFSALSVNAASPIKYTNSETGYKVVLIDDANLLTFIEENNLTEDMKPLTKYGNIAFWTTTEKSYNEIEQARLKRKELFNFDSGCIFVINMEIRKLTIQSYGNINQSVTDSLARSITNNVSSYATSKNYYTCAKTAFEQINTVCEKKHISEPLKISGYVVISLMLGLIIAIGVAFSKRQNPLIRSYAVESERPYHINGTFRTPVTVQYVKQVTEHRPPITYSSSGGGGSIGCSSCSSGSSCSSCSSGSSCSSCGGGGCGSGGSSDF